MILTGLSSGLTGNKIIQGFNFCWILVFLVFMLLHNFCNDRQWGLIKYIACLLYTSWRIYVNHPGVILALVFIVFACVVVSVVAAVLSHLVVKAADLQEQSDLTI